jgi:condensin complex subunit 2
MSDTETDTSVTSDNEQRTPSVTPRKNPMLNNFSPMRKPEAIIEENNDEMEKQLFRAKDELKRRRSSFHVKKVIISPQNNAKRRKSRAIRRLTPSDLATLFNDCIKLSTENKINAKNSWNLNLIDYIDEVIENNTDTNQSNFQIASCTLDASIKIYSCRVDSVHTETYKVLGELNRTDKRETSEKLDSEEPQQEEGEQATDKKKKKVKKFFH